MPLIGATRPSTSISAGLGLVRAREIVGGDHFVVSVIGDGSLTGGMAYGAARRITPPA